MKVHLYRSTRTTWCGRKAAPLMPEHLTSDVDAATCRVCIKADAAEDRRNNEASH